MIKNDQQDYSEDDPEAQVRKRVMAQLQAPDAPSVETPAAQPRSVVTPAANPDPVYAPPDPAPTFPVGQKPTAPTQQPDTNPGGVLNISMGGGMTGPNGQIISTQPVPGGRVGPETPPTGPAPAGSDPAAMVDALYQQYGIKDGGRGAGFADRAYWLEHPSEILNGRLGADLAGTGTDQPTGTPGSGPWQNSGRGQRGATGAMGAMGAMGTQGATGLTAPTGVQFQPFGGGGGQQSQGFWTPDFTNQIRQILLQRLQAAGQPVDENAPGIAGAVTSARDEATRQSTTERNALAERLYAQGGLNTDALTQQIQQSGERNASAVGSIRAQLILKEVDQRRQELDSLLQMATASGDAESARQIQMQIAMLNKQVQEEGLNLDASKYSAYLNQNAALAGLRG